MVEAQPVQGELDDDDALGACLQDLLNGVTDHLGKEAVRWEEHDCRTVGAVEYRRDLREVVAEKDLTARERKP